MFQVARNRIVDLFRRRKISAVAEFDVEACDDELGLRDLLPTDVAGPDAVYARSILLEEISEAIAELPEEQREVLLAHEIEGRSFQEMALRSGVSINTLLSRKRYAILHLRRRLQNIYGEFGKG
jgi:RNA polymerase sigma factor (sigma-70 family)